MIMEKDFLQSTMSRREFGKWCLRCGLGLAVSPILLDMFKLPAHAAVPAGQKGFIGSKEALFYVKLDDKRVQCQLCPRYCTLTDGMRSFCRVREPHQGKLYTHAYGNPASANPYDPIEKKPLFHFLPATTTFSIATAGCNFRCKCCQNWQISQVPPEETNNYALAPEEVVAQAFQYRCPTIAYTYSEPSIFYEYMLDTAKIARAKGLRNIYHSNGSLNAQPAEELAQYLDAANIDLKGFTQEFYSEIPEGFLDTVLETLKILRRKGVWLEITTLVIPTFNDDKKQIQAMAQWIHDNLGADTPLHFSRFFPLHRLKNISPTPVSTLEMARATATDAGLHYVYIGNVPGHAAESTYCPQCKKPVIRRQGYSIIEKNIDAAGRSRCCNYPIAGVWG